MLKGVHHSVFYHHLTTQGQSGNVDDDARGLFFTLFSERVTLTSTEMSKFPCCTLGLTFHLIFCFVLAVIRYITTFMS